MRPCSVLFPHMHLRGKRFEYDIVHDDGTVETLLRVNYHFHWQLSYRLAEPRLLKAGTRLRAIAWYGQFEEESAQSGPREDRDLGRSDVGRNDGGIF